MNCNECCWCKYNNANEKDENKVCCNRDSENYNKIFTEEEAENMTCELAETQRAVDYRQMTPWQFASKYYS